MAASMAAAASAVIRPPAACARASAASKASAAATSAASSKAAIISAVEAARSRIREGKGAPSSAVEEDGFVLALQYDIEAVARAIFLAPGDQGAPPVLGHE